MKELVSIIVPVYNAGNYLDRCIGSIVNQSYHCFELILIDDGSQDQSKERCQFWQSKDHRVRYHYQDNCGVSSARNAGMDRAKGKFVIFVDADDYLDTSCIESLMSAQAMSHADMVISNAKDVYEDGTIIYGKGETSFRILNKKEAVYQFFKEDYYYPVCWGRLYTRSLIDSIRFDVNMRIAEDGKFFLEAINQCNRICIIPERLYYYYCHTGSVVHSGFSEKFFDELLFCKHLAEEYRGKEDLELASRMKLYRFIRRLLRMEDFPANSYHSLLRDSREAYGYVKPYLPLKERAKYNLLLIRAYWRNIRR